MKRSRARQAIHREFIVRFSFISLVMRFLRPADFSPRCLLRAAGCKTLLRARLRVLVCRSSPIRRLFVIGSMARAVAAAQSRLAADGLIRTFFAPCVSFFVAGRLFSCFLIIIIGLRALLHAQCTPFQLDRDYKSIYALVIQLTGGGASNILLDFLINFSRIGRLIGSRAIKVN